MTHNSLDECWSEIVKTFHLTHHPPHRIKSEGVDVTTPKTSPLTRATLEYLARNGVGVVEKVTGLLYEILKVYIREEVAVKFWSVFETFKPFIRTDRGGGEHDEIEEDAHYALRCGVFVNVIDYLYSEVKHVILPYCTRLDLLLLSTNTNSSCTKKLSQNHYISSVFSHLWTSLKEQKMVRFNSSTDWHNGESTTDWSALVSAFYCQSFHAFRIRQERRRGELRNDMNEEYDDEYDDLISSMCEGCQLGKECCACNYILEDSYQVSCKLHVLKIFHSLTFDSIRNVIRWNINRHIDETCNGNFTVKHLAELESWFDITCVGWLRMIYSVVTSSSNQFIHDLNSTVNDIYLKEFISLDDIEDTPPEFRVTTPMDGSRSSQDVDDLRSQYLYFLRHQYILCLINQLFSIIIDYPDSIPVLQELRSCLLVDTSKSSTVTAGKSKTCQDFRSLLTEELMNVMKRRLLHPGVSTTDIVTAYVSAIRALRIVDPAGVILENVCSPVGEYLKNVRQDTIRCIVQSLIDDDDSNDADGGDGSSGTDLITELKRGSLTNSISSHHYVNPETGVAYDENGYELCEGAGIPKWNEWEPDPIDAVESYESTPTPRLLSSDIIAMLINIYGSKELFVTEYRTLLSNRLLDGFTGGGGGGTGSVNNAGNDQGTTSESGVTESSKSGGGSVYYAYENGVEKEIRNLELLKLRFGESSLNQCEVMLKDVADSKRINSSIRDVLNSTSSVDVMDDLPKSNANQKQGHSVNALTLSAQFWPTLESYQHECITLSVPELAKRELDSYTNTFERLKGNRTLVWKPQLGSVDIELQFLAESDDENGHVLKKCLTVTTVHASIIMMFEKSESWRLDALARELSLPQSVLRRKISFWVNNGILKKEMSPVLMSNDSFQHERYILVDRAPPQLFGSSSCQTTGKMRKVGGGAISTSDGGGHNVNMSLLCEREIEDEDNTSTRDLDGMNRRKKMEREELDKTLTVYWAYITNMLINFDSLPFERIHQMLMMFALVPTASSSSNSSSTTSTSHSCSSTMTSMLESESGVQELKNLLKLKMREEQLLFKDGEYSLPRQ